MFDFWLIFIFVGKDNTNFPSDEGIRKLADKNSNKVRGNSISNFDHSNLLPPLLDQCHVIPIKWSVNPQKAISNKIRVVEYYADFLIYSLSIPMYVAVLLFVYYLWGSRCKGGRKRTEFKSILYP